MAEDFFKLKVEQTMIIKICVVFKVLNTIRVHNVSNEQVCTCIWIGFIMPP